MHQDLRTHTHTHSERYVPTSFHYGENVHIQTGLSAIQCHSNGWIWNRCIPNKLFQMDEFQMDDTHTHTHTKLGSME